MNKDPEFIWVNFQSELYKRTVELRQAILRTPLGLKFSEDELSREGNDHHLAVLQEGILIGCLVLSPYDEATLKMRQVAVLEKSHGKGIGKKMLKESEIFSRKKGIQKIILNARQTVVPFYEKLGYSVVSDVFMEVTIPHLKMEKII